jgi:hypothetical protein
MKVALCFIISYEHIINKENIWREWIDHNKDIINVYFYYKDLKKIKSEWILNHIVDSKNIRETSYYHVIPAYLSVMSYAYNHSYENQWFCILTESCCPIISPNKFRNLFYNNYSYSIFNWHKCWWDIQKQKRANLYLLPENLQLANDPYFILKREDVQKCFKFTHINKSFFKIICEGGLANESLFAIILSIHNSLKNVKKYVTHLTDWSRMSSSTSPYLFKEGSINNIKFIENGLKKNIFAIFIRKISPEFPDEIIRDFIYNKTYEEKIIWSIWSNPFFFRKPLIICINIIINISILSLSTLLLILLYTFLNNYIPLFFTFLYPIF